MGKRTRSWRAYGCPWDHPRVGGEKMNRQQLRAKRPGSPPHGRGKAPALQPWRPSPGITPAWAGKSLSSFLTRCSFQDHPRMGGEKPLHGHSSMLLRGSPPHGRGKGRKSTRAKLGIRITPAWAGKRACCPSLSDRRQDHPRMGGEKLYEQMEQGAGRGSPPHGRGKVCRCCCGRTAAGITPAWAGKSVSR